MAMSWELCQGHVLFYSRWPLWSCSHLVLQWACALALLGSIFLLFLLDPWSHSSSECAGAARSLGNGRQSPLHQAARLPGCGLGVCVGETEHPWVRNRGSWHYLPPLAVYNAQQRQGRNERRFFPSASLNVGAEQLNPESQGGVLKIQESTARSLTGHKAAKHGLCHHRAGKEVNVSRCI